MTTILDVANRSLQAIGTRTNMTQSEFTTQSSNEAIQTNMIIYNVRDELLRMAPWNCATNVINLTYITSVPGTPENPTPATLVWQKGQPYPPWAYEYQYPGDCLRPLWVIPAAQAGFPLGIPITSAITGNIANIWTGPAAKFRVSIDQFFAITAATVASGGAGYAVGDLIILAGPGAPPIGAPGQLRVTSVSGGAVTGVAVVNSFSQSDPQDEPVTGSYFNVQPNPISQGATSGPGLGATFNATFTTQMDQRVILTNQEFATLAYLKRIEDPSVMDPLLIQAWVATLGARLVYNISGDKAAANEKLKEANLYIAEARKPDGNEGLTINDVTPDWIRTRGLINPADFAWTPNVGYDWGQLLTLY